MVPFKPVSLGVYIVDSDAEKKMRLKAAATPVALFHRIVLFHNLQEALNKIEVDGDCDIVFLSSRFEEKEISDFIAEVKHSPNGSDATFVLVLGLAGTQNQKLPEYMLLGIDGFLFEPYSVEGLTDTANLALKLRKERQGSRERLAIAVLVKDIMKQVDAIALTKRLGLGSSKLSARLEALGAAIRKLPDETIYPYLNLLVEEMIASPLPEKMSQFESYKGASTRVKKVIEKKILEELEKETTG